MNIRETEFNKIMSLKYNFGDNQVTIEYKKIKYKDSKDESFLVGDILGILKKDIVLITLLSKGDRNKGKGNGVKALKDFVKFCKNIPIAVAVSPIVLDEETFHTLIENGILDKLSEVYKKVGFRNINEVVGYNNSIAMIRCSDKDYDKIMGCI